MYGVEGRYATALFSAASKQNKLDQVEQELGKVSVSQQKRKLFLMLLPLNDENDALLNIWSQGYVHITVIYLNSIAGCLNMLFVWFLINNEISDLIIKYW